MGCTVPEGLSRPGCPCSLLGCVSRAHPVAWHPCSLPSPCQLLPGLMCEPLLFLPGLSSALNPVTMMLRGRVLGEA